MTLHAVLVASRCAGFAQSVQLVGRAEPR